MEHHVIPQFYLRGFRDPRIPASQGPQLRVADLARGRIQLRSPRGIAHRTDYYAVSVDAGDPDQEIETVILQRVESAAARVIADLQAGCYLLDADARDSLALFMALLITRLPSWRGTIEATAGKLSEAIMRVAAAHPAYFERRIRTWGGLPDVTAAEIEDIRCSVLEPGNYEYRGTPDLSLRQMLRVAMGLSGVLRDMRWIFLTAPRGSRFMTSDNPIHWNDSEAPEPWNAGLSSPRTVLSFPMSSELCLMASWHRHLQPSREAPHDVLAAVNRRTVQFADLEVYAADRGDAEAALTLREGIKQAGEPVGPRPPNFIILAEPDQPR